MKTVILLLFCLLANGVTAQVKFTANMTDSRLAKLKKSKDARTKLQRYQKMYSKDSVKASKESRKFLKDSLGGKRMRKAYSDSLKLKELYKNNLNSYLGRAGLGEV